MMFRTNPGTWKLGVFWERIHAESTQNSLVQSPEPPEQLWCAPGSEHYLKSVLELPTTSSTRILNTRFVEGNDIIHGLKPLQI
jgi:hypothetical protein